MPALQKLSDETLRDYLNKGFSQAEIAKLCHVAEGTISKRVKALDRRTAAKSPPIVTEVMASVWDTKAAAEENYRRSLDLLSDCENALEKTRAISEIRQHIEFGAKLIEKLYEISEIKAFQEAVLETLAECDPALRDTVIEKLRKRRPVGVAFFRAS